MSRKRDSSIISSTVSDIAPTLSISQPGTPLECATGSLASQPFDPRKGTLGTVSPRTLRPSHGSTVTSFATLGSSNSIPSPRASPNISPCPKVNTLPHLSVQPLPTFSAPSTSHGGLLASPYDSDDCGSSENSFQNDQEAQDVHRSRGDKAKRVKSDLAGSGRRDKLASTQPRNNISDAQVKTAPSSPVEVSFAVPHPPSFGVPTASSSRAKSEGKWQDTDSISSDNALPPTVSSSSWLPKPPPQTLVEQAGGRQRAGSMASQSSLHSNLSPRGSVCFQRPMPFASIQGGAGGIIADAQLIKLSKWCNYVLGQLIDFSAGKINTVSVEPLSTFSAVKGLSPLPLQPAGDALQHSLQRRKLSLVGSQKSGGSSQGASTSPALESISSGAPSPVGGANRSSSVRKASFASGRGGIPGVACHSVASYSRVGEHRNSAVPMSREDKLFVEDVVTTMLLQANEELTAIGRRFVVVSEEAKFHYVELCDRVISSCAGLLMGRSTSPRTGAGVVSPRSMSVTSDPLDDTSPLCLRIGTARTLLFQTRFDWSAAQKTVVRWFVGLVRTGDCDVMDALLGHEGVLHVVTGKDAKYILSTCASTLAEHPCPHRMLALLMRVLPRSPVLIPEREELRPVWQETVALTLRHSPKGCANESSIEVANRLAIVDLVELYLTDELLSSHSSPASPLLEVDFGNLEANDKQTIFSRACREGDVNLVNHLLQHRDELGLAPFLNRVQSDGTNAAQQAAARGHLTVVKALCGLPPEVIAPSFIHEVKGKGSILTIARSLSSKSDTHRAITTLLEHFSSTNAAYLQRLLESTHNTLRRDSRVESQSRPGANNGDGELGSLLDSVAAIEGEMLHDGPAYEERQPSRVAARTRRLSIAEVSTISPIEAHAKAVEKLEALTATPSNTAGGGIESLSHEDAVEMRRLFRRAQEFSWPSRDADAIAAVDRLNRKSLELVRRLMKRYLGIGGLECEDGSQLSHFPVEQVLHSLVTSRKIRLVAMDPMWVWQSSGGEMNSLATVFGFQSDAAPMPSRVSRFLDAVREAPVFQDPSTVTFSTSLLEVAVQDDWLVASLSLDGMLHTILSECTKAQGSTCSEALSKGVERLLSAMSLVLQSILSNNSPHSPRRSEGDVFYSSLALVQGCDEQCPTLVFDSAGSCTSFIKRFRIHLTTIMSLYDVGSPPRGATKRTIDVSRSSKPLSAARFAARNAAFQFVKALCTFRSVLFGGWHGSTASSPERGNRGDGGEQPDSFTSPLKSQRSGSTFGRAGSSFDAPDLNEDLVRRNLDTLIGLLWCATEVFPEVDEPSFLTDETRRMLIQWLLPLVVTTVAPCASQRSLVPVLTALLLDVACCSDLAETLFPTRLVGSCIQVDMNWFCSADILQSLCVRASLAGDTQLLQPIFSLLLDDRYRRVLPSSPEGLSRNVLNFSPLMFAASIGEASAAQMLVRFPRPCGNLEQYFSSRSVAYHDASSLASDSVHNVSTLFIARILGEDRIADAILATIT